MGKSVIAVIAAATVWANLAIPVNFLLDQGLSVLHLVAARGFFAALVMLAYILWKSPKLLKVRLRDLWMFAAMGIVSFSFFNFCLFNAFGRIGVSLSVALMYTSPIFVTLISRVVFKEKITPSRGAALLLAVAGCVLVTGALESTVVTDGTGILLAVASGLFYGLYSIFGTLALRRYAFSTTLFYTFLFTFLGGALFSGPGQALALLGQEPSLILWAALLGSGFTILPFALYTYGLSRLGPSRAAILATVEPLVAAVMSRFVFHEQLTALQAGGIGVIVLAVILISASGRRAVDKTPPGAL